MSVTVIQRLATYLNDLHRHSHPHPTNVNTTMTEVAAPITGLKRPAEEELDNQPIEKRVKVALKADPEWNKEEEAEYAEDKDEYVPAGDDDAEEEYYEVDLKEEDVSEDKIMEDLISIKDIMPEGYEFDEDSMNAIKLLAKDFLVDVFANAKLIAKTIGKRDVVMEEDIQVAVEIMQRSAKRAVEKEEEKADAQN